MERASDDGDRLSHSDAIALIHDALATHPSVKLEEDEGGQFADVRHHAGQIFNRLVDRRVRTVFQTTALTSLNRDLNPMPGATVDPGPGLDVARFLGDFMPVCPVLIHSSNTDRVYSMHHELRFAGWMADRVGPIGSD